MKKLLALVLALVMTMSLVTISNAAYSDAADIDYTEAVEVMSAIGVLEGSDGKFDPDGILTREQAAKIIAYMILGKTAADSLSTTSAPFADVAADRWSAGAIAYCATEGIIAGVGNGNFDPTGKLTGYAFGKMCLVALGYDAKQEGLVGTDWMISTAKLIINAGLDKKLGDVALVNQMSRQEAAQMAFNTEKATMVQYTNGTNITTSDGTKVTVNAVRSFVPQGANDYSTGLTTGDGTMQFCEQYCTKLKMSKDSATEDFSRPSTVWVYKNKTVGAYADAATLVYTKAYDKGTSADLKAVKADIKGWTTAIAAIDTAEEICDLTGNGRVVELFVEDNVIYDYVVIDYYLATVKKATATKLTFTCIAAVNAVESTDDNWDLVSSFKTGDKLVVAVDGTNDIIEAYAPTVVASGKYTKKTGSTYTVGGEGYKVSANGAFGGTLDTYYSLLLDKYGYIMAINDEEVAKNYAYVLDYSANVNKGNYDFALQLLKADGTKTWLDVTKLGSDVVADGEVTTGALAAAKGNFVAYDEDGVCTVYVEDTGTICWKDDVTAITKGNSALTGLAGKVASSETVFLVKQADKSYKAYTGIKNVPSMTVTGDKTLVNGAAVVMVVIDANTTTGAQDQIFIFKDENSAEFNVSGVGKVYTYKAIVNGEETTIDVANSVFAGTAVKGLYVDSGYTKNVVTSTTGAVTSSSAGEYYYVDVTTDGLADITLKNGVLTLDATADKVFVMADEYNAWYINNTGDNVETLALAKAGTFGGTNAYPAMVAGDYAIVVFDDDGYVTDLYFFDNVVA